MKLSAVSAETYKTLKYYIVSTDNMLRYIT